VEWIGEIPENWNVSSIGRYTNLGRGRVISHLEIQENIGNFPVYSSQTENNGVMGFINTYDFEGEYVTWTTDGANAGTVSYRSGKFNCTNVCGTIQPRDDEQIVLRFLPYLLNLGTKFSVRLDINPKLMNNMMAKIPLVLPSKTEQTAIASFLDRKTAEIDQLIANKEKLIALYEEEKTAIINRAVTRGLDPQVSTKPSGVDWLGDIPEHWEVKRLKYLTLILNDGTHGTFKRTTLGYRLLSVRNIKNDEFVFLDDDSRISEEDFDIITKPFLVKEGDLQLAIVGATLGKVAIVPELDEKFATQRSVATIRTKKELIHNKFLFYFLKSSSFQSFLWLNAGFSAQPGIYLGSLANCHVPTPNLTEQAAIVVYIETECSRLDTIIDKFKKQIELFKEYRTTMISEVVTGKIDVRDEVAA
jgi:type I restriction enzyme S subunit